MRGRSLTIALAGALYALSLFGASSVRAEAAVVSQNLYVAQGQLVVIPSRDGQWADMVETLVFHNGTGRKASVAIPLPQGASDFAVVAMQTKGWEIRGADLVNQSVMPGDSIEYVSMRAALGGQSAILTWDTPYDVRELYVVVPQGGLFLSAEGGFLTASQTFVDSAVTYRRFTKLDIQPGVPWAMSMTLLPTAEGRQTPLPKGLPILNAYSRSSADWEALGNLVLAVAILTVGMVSIRWSGLKASAQSRRTDRRRAGLLAQREQLMRTWTEWERTHQSERTTADEAVRADFKERAVAIDRELSSLHALQSIDGGEVVP